MFYSSVMTQALNGSGTGKNNQTAPPPKLRAPAGRDAHVMFKTPEGTELNGMLKHFTHQSATFELYGETVTLRLSESLADFQINTGGQAIYAGHAVISNLVDNASRITCEVSLEKNRWVPDADLAAALQAEGGPVKQFEKFEREWQRLYAISPEFKVAGADMQTFLHDLQLWLNQVAAGFNA